ncbi:TIGR00299 family protein [Dictyobacter alpinus]|uniref:TIGR00299 family protein n=1 Tax=Dictyobacter alpinus TaxID=2014873 RepID=A0A402B9Z2_9CHLR|nr:LarC family nickel insertion protein [Dictyobacter alpinus]GCE28204.1 TIGR00299 family protein [Dictyobacter alpinus]
MTRKMAFIDCSLGSSGSLWLSTLMDLGLSVASIRRALAAVDLDIYQVEPLQVFERGASGIRLAWTSLDQVTLRSLDAWSQQLKSSALPEPVIARVLACLRCLAEAESVVHDTPLTTIQLSSVALMELVCVVSGLLELNISELYASPLPLNTGFEGEHDLAPSPVTLEILRASGASWKPVSSGGEPVTPVGAALLVTCARFEVPVFSIERVGYGFGSTSQNPPAAMRLYLGTSTEVEEPASIMDADTDWVAVIESNLDTMTGELLGGLMERLFTLGALDVTYTPLQMKKNRPATLLTVICPVSLGDQLALILLRETPTLGVRIQHIRRLKAQREQVRIDTALGPMLVKIKRLGAQLISASPEYEECQRIATMRQLPLIEVYEVARDAIKNVIIDKKDRIDTTTQEN